MLIHFKTCVNVAKPDKKIKKYPEPLFNKTPFPP